MCAILDVVHYVYMCLDVVFIGHHHVCLFHTAKEATDPGFVEKLVTQIIKNVQVRLRACVCCVCIYTYICRE